MKTQIKVTDTRMHKIYDWKCTYTLCNGNEDKCVRNDCESEGEWKEIPVVEGKLILIRNENIFPELDQIGFNLSTGGLFWNQVAPSKQIEKLVGVITPIIISETEKIEAGVDYMYAWGQIQKPDKTYKKITGSTKKILALPEHFSSKHLQAIVDGKMKDGVKVLVQCEGIEWLDRLEYFTKLSSQGHITLHRMNNKHTWADINAIGYDEWKENGGLSSFEPWYVNWLEENFEPPKRK